jgi:hypothetical protein
MKYYIKVNDVWVNTTSVGYKLVKYEKSTDDKINGVLGV